MKNDLFEYPIQSDQVIEKLIKWIDQNYAFYCLTFGNGHDYPEGTFPDQILAGNTALEDDSLWEDSNYPAAGIISYDYKNQLEKLSSKNPILVKVPDLTFFKAELRITWDGDKIYSNQALPEKSMEGSNPKIDSTPTEIQALTSKEEYIRAFEAIQNEIIEGNTYEMNYCIAYQASFEKLDPIISFFKLMQLSPMPFSGLFKSKEKYLISASPERFLKKEASRLIAQPIKGTSKRGKNKEEDEANKRILLQSEKERAENLMITDLMRNDLSKVSQIGSVHVPELFGVYSFPKVHQMISTVQSNLLPKIGLKEILQATFPMGSMTGAPKISTMELIEKFENFQRGWFSGALGIIQENGDFDFSVIIRSIVADLETKKLYFAVGSAITIDAEAEQEYEECLLKASALLEVLRGS